MKLLILLAMLSGWLFSEIKEFFYNGGLGNLLAFGLLRIVFVLSSIIITVMFIIFPRFIYEACWLLKQNFMTYEKNKENNESKLELMKKDTKEKRQHSF
jgi:ribosomal protein L33